MKSLRDRIAAAALNTYEGNSEAWKWSEGDIKRRDWLEIADAVIAELALERQDHYDPDCDYYRYATDWIAPNA